MGFPAAELCDEGENRRRVGCISGEPAQHHARVLFQRAGEAGAREKLRGVIVIVGRSARNDLLQRDRELVGIERAPFADLAPRLNDFVPRFQCDKPLCYSACSSW